MSNLIADERWYRVGSVKPYLLAGVDISPHDYRGESWFVLRDPVNGELHRIDRASYDVVKRLDGIADIASIHQALLTTRGDAAPTQQETMQLLAELAQAGLIQTDRAGDVEQLKWRDRHRRRTRLADRINPLSFKVAMVNIEPLIDRLEPLSRVLFSRAAAVFSVLLGLLAAGMAILSASDITTAIVRVHTNPTFLFMMWLAYPLMKACHELAHALAARRFGARVTDIGVRLLVLMPVPYVDASTSALLPDKRHRAIVAAAGIAAELLIAALAMLLWLQIEAGLLADFTLALVLIGAVSTLFFNGNPLLRFDGYYVLTDLLELPNLAKRSRQYLLNAVMIHALRIHRVATMRTAPGEKPWLLVYAIAAWCYRVIVFASISFFVAQVNRPAGVLIALAGIVLLIIMPLARGALFLQSSPTLAGRRAMTGVLISGYVLTLAIILVVPAPNNTIAQGVVWLPEQAALRAEVGGTMATLRARDGEHITRGETVAELTNTDLVLQMQQLASRVDALEVERLGELAARSAKADSLLPQLEHARAELAKARNEVDALRITAPASGRLVLPHASDREQTWVEQGETLGYVLGSDNTTVRVALTNEQALQLRQGSREVHVQLAELPGRNWPATVTGQAPAAQQTLPSAALGQPAGGQLAVDPSDPEGRRTLSSIFVLDVQIDGRDVARSGATALVRFDHPDKALLFQVGDALRSLLLRHFDA